MKSADGCAAGFGLLAVAGVAALFGLWNAGAALVWGLTPGRFASAWFAAGLAITAGFLGYFVRKFVAGQVLPVEYDVSVAFRGGQGRLYRAVSSR